MMKATTMNPATSNTDAWLSAIDIMVRNVMRIDTEARLAAKEEDCIPELLTIQRMFLDELEELRANAN